MRDVMCVITVPDNWTGDFRLLYSFIDGEGCKESVESGAIRFEKEDVVTADGLYVKAILIGPPSLDIKMDVYIGGRKYNKKPILPTISNQGEYVFAYAI